ncbi:MAG TPA: hypothetical protein VJ506_03120 [Candidatus Limnocylindrales bacterium]|nr:hypothetical protein [Candidatus Limnocylindrales bacterium]
MAASTQAAVGEEEGEGGGGTGLEVGCGVIVGADEAAGLGLATTGDVDGMAEQATSATPDNARATTDRRLARR